MRYWNRFQYLTERGRREESVIDSTKQGDLRTSMETAKDARVVKTRQRLLDALSLELRKGADADLSPANLSRVAGVSRATFYAHFSASEELASHGLVDFLDNITLEAARSRQAGSETPYTAAHRAIRLLVEELSRDRSRLVLAFTVTDHSILRGRFFETIAAAVTRAVTIERPELSEAQIQSRARIIASGVMTGLIDWLRNGMPEPDNEVEIIMDCLPGWLIRGRRPE